MVLYALFFFVGMNKAYLYLPLFSVYFLLDFIEFKKFKLIKEYIFWIFCIFSIILAFCIFGAGEILVNNKINILYFTLFSIIFIGYIYQNCALKERERLLKIYILGMGAEAIIIVIFSCYLNDNYGYGRLFDPFSNKEINSPGISENLALLSIIFIYEFFQNRSFVVRFISSVTLIFLILLGLYLASRTYFIILLLSLIIILTNKAIYKNINFKFKYIGVAVIFVILIIKYRIIDEYFSISLERFSSGIESKRFDHYSDGVEKLLEHPFGGFSTSIFIENTPWFHNIFLDVARIGGWLPLIPLFAIIFFVIYQIKKSNFQSMSIAIPISMAIILIMQQGVIIEGNLRLIFILFFCSICMIKLKKR